MHLEHAHDLDPAAHFDVLRRTCPVHHEDDHDPPFFVVSRYADVLAALRDPDRWQLRDGPGVYVAEGGVLGATDDPDHRRQRSVLAPAFRPATVLGLTDRVAAVGRELLDRVAPLGEGDIVPAFAFPLPAIVIGEVLGVRTEDRDRFGEWADDVVKALGGGDMERNRIATRQVWDYVDVLVEERLSALGGTPPGTPADEVLGTVVPDDVVARLTVAHRDGILSRTEVRRLAHQLLVAGHETTASLIAAMCWRLAVTPGLEEQLRRAPERHDVFVEECVRLDAPVQGLFRTSPDDAEIQGVHIPARIKVQLLFAAANRDPDAWPDADELRLDRDLYDLRRHLGFGAGVHYCIGAPLARLVARVALGLVLERLHDLVLAGEPRLNEPFILRGCTSLPLRWTPAG